jgi:predicted nucleic acid-binding protein
MASNGVFLDTNGWLALLNDDDSLHAGAFRVWSRFVRERRSVMLTDWIVAETGNGLARTPQRRRRCASP